MVAWVAVEWHEDAPAAKRARGTLVAAGIPCELRIVESVTPILGRARHSTALLVQEADAAQASRILEDAESDEDDLELDDEPDAASEPAAADGSDSGADVEDLSDEEAAEPDEAPEEPESLESELARERCPSCGATSTELARLRQMQAEDPSSSDSIRQESPRRLVCVNCGYAWKRGHGKHW